MQAFSIKKLANKMTSKQKNYSYMCNCNCGGGSGAPKCQKQATIRQNKEISTIYNR